MDERKTNKAAEIMKRDPPHTVARVSRIIFCDSTPLPMLTQQHWLEYRPRFVADIVSMLQIFHFGTFSSSLIPLYHISPVDTTQ